MLEWITVARSHVGGSEFVLARHGDDWVVRVDQRTLMSNRMHDSEIALAEHALDRVDDPEHVLVGGLGLGYTLRAVLDVAPEHTNVTVAELVPALVEWNREYLGPLNDHPLDDPRVDVALGDVFDTLKRSRGAYDAVLLDVDNGPVALAQETNQRLYSDNGVRVCAEALAPGGVLAVWSAGPNARYEQRLARFGFDVDVVRVAARVGSRAKHVLFLGTRR
jgi:spermidine synthase